MQGWTLGEVLRTLLGLDDLVLAAARGLVAFMVVYLPGRLVVVPTLVRAVDRRNPDNPTLGNALRRYLSGLVVILAAVAFLSGAGYGRLLTGSALVVAALTLALGVAGRDVIGNIVAGLFLVVDPDFNVDDWISWPDGEGVVEAISFRVTRVRTADNEVVIVPNTVLATNQVTRPYGREDFRITVEFGVPPDADFDAVTHAIRAEADAIDAVLDDPPPQVRITGFGDDDVVVRAAFWVNDPERADVVRTRSEFFRAVNERLGGMGVAINPPSEHDLSGTLGVRDAREGIDVGDRAE